MHRNLSKMETKYGFKNFEFIPKTFILPNDFGLLKNVIIMIV